jgi:hypothetical protein
MIYPNSFKMGYVGTHNLQYQHEYCALFTFTPQDQKIEMWSLFPQEIVSEKLCSH